MQFVMLLIRTYTINIVLCLLYSLQPTLLVAVNSGTAGMESTKSSAQAFKVYQQSHCTFIQECS